MSAMPACVSGVTGGHLDVGINKHGSVCNAKCASRLVVAAAVHGEEEGTGLHRVWPGGRTCSQEAAPDRRQQ